MIISVWRLIICHIMIYQLSTYYFKIFYIHTSLLGPSRSFYCIPAITQHLWLQLPHFQGGQMMHLDMRSSSSFIRWSVSVRASVSLAKASVATGEDIGSCPCRAICRMQIFLLFTHNGKVLQGFHNNKPFKEVNQTIIQTIGIRIQDPMFFSNYLPAAGWTSVFPVGAQHNRT